MRLIKLFVVSLLVFPIVTVSVQADLSIRETDSLITILQNEKTVLTYNKTAPELPNGVEPIFRRDGFLHPVASPMGEVVTAVYPLDHKHQDGIFSAWVKTTYDGQEVDFWNIAKGKGRVRHRRVVSTFVGKQRAGFIVELIHQTQGESRIDVLLDTWQVTCSATDGSCFLFDIETTQEAMTDKPLTVEEYHYGGMAIRGHSAWLLDKKPTNKTPASRMLNNLGSEREAGNHQAAKWVVLTGRSPSTSEDQSHDVSIAVLSHSENFRAPQKARLNPSKPYFCFAPCADGSFNIDKDTPYQNRYRYIVTDDKPDADWLDKQWSNWTTK